MEGIQILGLSLELVFLAIGVSVYMFSAGFIKSIPGQTQKNVDKFRNENGRWLRILSLLLTAIMVVNIWLRIAGA